MLRQPTFLDRTNLEQEWLMDGGGTNSAGAIDLTPTNITWVSSERGYTSESAELNNTNAYLSNGTAQTIGIANSWTLEAYINGDTLSSTDDAILSLENPGVTANDAIFFRMRNNKVYLQNYSSTGSVIKLYVGNTSVSTNEWNHIMVTWDGTDLKFYINIVEDTYTKTTDNTGTMGTQTRKVQVGASNGVNLFDGGIGTVRIYSSVLTEKERKNRYLEFLRKLGPAAQLQSPKTSVTSGLQSEWPLNGNAIDIAGTSNGTWNNEAYSPVWGGETGSFNGTTSYVDVGTAGQISGNFSYTAEFKISDKTAVRKIFQSGLSGAGFYIATTGYIWFFRYYGSGTFDQVSTGVDTADGNTHTIVGTYNGTNLEIFLDGVSKGTTAVTSTAFYVGGGSSRIGEAGGASGQYWNGEIGGVKIYNTAISQLSIDKITNEGAKWVVGQKYSLSNLRDGLVLDISKAAVTGTYYDQSGNSNDFTEIGTVTNNSVGLMNMMNCASGNLRRNQAFNPGTGDFTYITTFKTTSSVGGLHLVSNLSTAAPYWRIRLNQPTTGKIWAEFYDLTNNPTCATSRSDMNNGDYYRLAFVRDSGTMRMYINGVEDNTATDSTSGNTLSNATDHAIGARGNDTERFDGELGGCIYENRAWSPEEIQQDFYSNFITS